MSPKDGLLSLNKYHWKIINQLQEVIDQFEVVIDQLGRVIVILGPLTYQVGNALCLLYLNFYYKIPGIHFSNGLSFIQSNLLMIGR